MGWIAGIAALAKHNREAAEQKAKIEQLRAGDPTDRYEYKVLRSQWSTFGKPERLNRVLDEESSAGWELPHKLDSSRIMLRRLRPARSADALLPPGVDPYRTMAERSGSAVLMVVVAVLVMGLVGDVAAGLSGISVAGSETILIGLVILLVAVILVALRPRWRDGAGGVLSRPHC
jgi:hypothetical protein